MKHLNLLSLGVAIIFVGFIIIFVGIISSLITAPKTAEKSNVKVSFFGLIGPIPFGFSNDKKLFIFTMVLALIFILAFFVFFDKGVK